MFAKQFEVWTTAAFSSPDSQHGNTHHVLVMQTNLLNKINHPSTIVCPITLIVKMDAEILRVHLKKGMANMPQECDIMIDQIQVIPTNRLIQKTGDIPGELIEKVKENILISLDLE
jgi:mRNA interferase MazF